MLMLRTLIWVQGRYSWFWKPSTSVSRTMVLWWMTKELNLNFPFQYVGLLKCMFLSMHWYQISNLLFLPVPWSGIYREYNWKACCADDQTREFSLAGMKIFFFCQEEWVISDCPIYLWRRSNNNSNNFCYCQLSLIYIWLPTWFYMQVDFVDFHLQINLYLLFFYEQSGTSQPGKKLSRFKATRQKQQ